MSSVTIFDARIIEGRPSVLSNGESVTGSDRSELVTVCDSTGKTDGLAVLTEDPESIKDDRARILSTKGGTSGGPSL